MKPPKLWVSRDKYKGTNQNVVLRNEKPYSNGEMFIGEYVVEFTAKFVPDLKPGECRRVYLKLGRKER